MIQSPVRTLAVIGRQQRKIGRQTSQAETSSNRVRGKASGKYCHPMRAAQRPGLERWGCIVDWRMVTKGSQPAPRINRYVSSERDRKIKTAEEGVRASGNVSKNALVGQKGGGRGYMAKAGHRPPSFPKTDRDETGRGTPCRRWCFSRGRRPRDSTTACMTQLVRGEKRGEGRRSSY